MRGREKALWKRKPGARAPVPLRQTQTPWGLSGRGPLGSGDTVRGHHLTCNMTQVKLKPAGRVPGPHVGVAGKFGGWFMLPAPFLWLQPHGGSLEIPRPVTDIAGTPKRRGRKCG